MLKHQIKSAFRNLLSNKAFTTINIVGLAIGLSASFVIGMLVYYDYTFDKHHKDSEHIYRITSVFTSPQEKSYNAGIAIPLINEVATNVSGVDKTASFYTGHFSKAAVKGNETNFKSISDVAFTTENYFKLFDYEWIIGKKESSLNEPNQVVLTDERAQRYFPNIAFNDILGKTITYEDKITVTVVGIVKKIKERTDFYFQEFVSKATVKGTYLESQIFNDQWHSTNSANQLFVKLNPSTTVASVQNQLDRIANSHTDKEMQQHGEGRVYAMQPLSDLHFNEKYYVFDYSSHQASKPVLVALILAATFLLLLACINFINLNTAQASKRLKEVGIRKTLGSSKKQLIIQFVLEAFILTLISGLISIILSALLLKQFTEFIPKGVDFSLIKEPLFIIGIILLIVLVSVLSGFYPALVLSKFKPISVIKSETLFVNGKSGVRKYLTVFQFVIAQIFIIATLLVGKQINYLLTKDMGFSTNGTAYVDMWDVEPNARYRFFEDVQKIPELSKISLGYRPPASSGTSSSRAIFKKKGEEIVTSLEFVYGDTNYLDVYNLKLLAGRDRLNDTIKEMVINETYAKTLGFDNVADAIGQNIDFGSESFPIVGVMKDFYQRSLRTSITPMALMGDVSRSKFPIFTKFNFSLANIPKSKWKTTIDKIEKVWKKTNPDVTFDVRFMDDTVRRFYIQETRTSKLLQWATGLAILISCLGLLGLVIYTTERRVKEISIRKVLGATLAQLNFLLAKEFLLLVFIACIIATPIAWYGLDYWLQGFAYKTSLSWWLFVASSFAMCIIALFVVGLRIWQTSVKNPTETLRSE